VLKSSSQSSTEMETEEEKKEDEEYLVSRLKSDPFAAAPNLDKINQDIEAAGVKLENVLEMGREGTRQYVQMMLVDIRDKTEVIHRHLRESRTWLARLQVALYNRRRVHAIKRKKALSEVTPLQRKGKSAAMLEAEIDRDPELMGLSEEVAQFENQEILWRTVVQILVDKEADLKRANSDVRLQANLIATEKQNYVSGEGIGMTAEKPKVTVPVMEKLTGAPKGDVLSFSDVL